MQRIYRVGGYATFAILLLTLSFLMPNFTQTSAEEPRALDQNSMRSVLQNSEILDLDSGLDLIMNDPDQFHWLLFASISGREENGSNEVLWETWATDDDTFPDSPKPSLCDSDDPPAENCPIWPGDELAVDDRSGVTQLEHAIASIPTPDRFGEVVYRN